MCVYVYICFLYTCMCIHVYVCAYIPWSLCLPIERHSSNDSSKYVTPFHWFIFSTLFLPGVNNGVLPSISRRNETSHCFLAPGHTDSYAHPSAIDWLPENLLGFQRGSNPSSENQQILNPAYPMWYSSKITVGSELMVQIELMGVW